MQYRAPLGLMVDPRNDDLVRRLAFLEKYDFSVITKDVSDKYGWSEEKAKEVELQFKRFMSLAWLDRSEYHIPEIDVDEYWHRAILHTQWYGRFCQDMFGSFYHHTPEPSPDNVNQRNRDRSLELIKYWYGQEWEHLVRTCTQSKGPVPTIDNIGLSPSREVIPAI